MNDETRMTPEKAATLHLAMTILMLRAANVQRLRRFHVARVKNSPVAAFVPCSLDEYKESKPNEQYFVRNLKPSNIMEHAFNMLKLNAEATSDFDTREAEELIDLCANSEKARKLLEIHVSSMADEFGDKINEVALLVRALEDMRNPFTKFVRSMRVSTAIALTDIAGLFLALAKKIGGYYETNTVA